ncbi:hypothetical protein F4861DRAFT_544552 [Xylaria intraflava]|nr:hypothetical protein F4861DRAFT_544552 [Xylaria intraflava]
MSQDPASPQSEMAQESTPDLINLGNRPIPVGDVPYATTEDEIYVAAPAEARAGLYGAEDLPGRPPQATERPTAQAPRIGDQLNLLLATPDLTTHPHLAFDGNNVTHWLEMVENVFQRRRIADDIRINQLPYFATTQDRIRTIALHLKNITTWGDAKAKLKKEYRYRDERQQQTPSDTLRDFEDSAHTFDVAGLKDYIDKHWLLVEDVKEAASQEGKEVRDRDFTSGLLRPLGSSIISKLIQETRKRLEEIKSMPYNQVQEQLNRLLSDEGDLENHELKQETSKARASRRATISAPRNNDRQNALVERIAKGKVDIDGKPMALARRDSLAPTEKDPVVLSLADELAKLKIHCPLSQLRPTRREVQQ